MGSCLLPKVFEHSWRTSNQAMCLNSSSLLGFNFSRSLGFNGWILWAIEKSYFTMYGFISICICYWSSVVSKCLAIKGSWAVGRFFLIWLKFFKSYPSSIKQILRFSNRFTNLGSLMLLNWVCNFLMRPLVSSVKECSGTLKSLTLSLSCRLKDSSDFWSRVLGSLWP